MSEIFYTQVDANVQEELNARGKAGTLSRKTDDLNYMLSKVASVSLIPYDTEYKKPDSKKEEVTETKTEITSAILGGFGVRTGEFLPSGPRGFLSDRPLFTNVDRNQDGKATKITGTAKLNNSKRIPPYITATSVQIGDDSMGVMQTATINITIPNPQQDLNYFESVYLKPGRHVQLNIAYPDTAIRSKSVTGGYVSAESMPSTKKLELIFPDIADDQQEARRYGKMNEFIFNGVITTFTLDYQEDASVAASLTIRGTSQIYSDVTLAMNHRETKKPTNEQIETVTTFFNAIKTEFENKQKENNPIGVPSLSGIWQNPSNDNIWYIWGDTHSNQSGRYITLGALIDFVNRFLVSKLKATLGNIKIICDKQDNLCTSTYYENIVSANPKEVFFPGGGEIHDIYSTSKPSWFDDSLNNFEDYVNVAKVKGARYKKPSFSAKDIILNKMVSYPSMIFIELRTIQSIQKTLKDNNTYTVQAFLEQISSLIYSASGNAIDMQLVTHPERRDVLLYYDANNVSNQSVFPYDVPMFANHPSGTIVTGFSFNAKLPDSAATLAYVMNQDPDDISDSDIAPYLSYMYSANTYERGVLNGNYYEAPTNLVNEDTLKKIEDKYKTNYETYLKEFQTAKETYANNGFVKDDERIALEEAMRKHIQYPKSILQDTNQLKAPVIPFDASFDIEGINGLKYGDVLKFSGLPERYTINTVFSIISISHDVSTEGVWKTSIKCIMRPRIT
jgi:hypothetical protein